MVKAGCRRGEQGNGLVAVSRGRGGADQAEASLVVYMLESHTDED